MAIKPKIISSLPYFSGLSPDQIESVKEFFVEKKLEKGDLLLYDGEPCDYAYFVISGWIKLCKKSEDGREQIMAIASKGDSLGDVAILDNSPNTVDFLAMTPLHVYAIKKKDLETIILEYPQVALNALRIMASRVHQDTALVGELSFNTVINRLAKLIIKQAAVVPDNSFPRLTQQDIASMVGTSRVVISRSLRVMEEKGAIRLERRRIVIIDEAALKELAGVSP